MISSTNSPSSSPIFVPSLWMKEMGTETWSGSFDVILSMRLLTSLTDSWIGSLSELDSSLFYLLIFDILSILLVAYYTPIDELLDIFNASSPSPSSSFDSSLYVSSSTSLSSDSYAASSSNYLLTSKCFYVILASYSLYPLTC